MTAFFRAGYSAAGIGWWGAGGCGVRVWGAVDGGGGALPGGGFRVGVYVEPEIGGEILSV